MGVGAGFACGRRCRNNDDLSLEYVLQTRAAMDVGFLHPDILYVKQTDNCRINTAPPTKF